MYIGSVRFYKHIILTALALIIIAPIVISCLLFAQNTKLNSRISNLNKEVLQIEYELKNLSKSGKESSPGETMTPPDTKKEQKSIKVKEKEEEESTTATEHYAPELGLLCTKVYLV